MIPTVSMEEMSLLIYEVPEVRHLHQTAVIDPKHMTHPAREIPKPWVGSAACLGKAMAPLSDKV